MCNDSSHSMMPTFELSNFNDLGQWTFHLFLRILDLYGSFQILDRFCKFWDYDQLTTLAKLYIMAHKSHPFLQISFQGNYSHKIVWLFSNLGFFFSNIIQNMLLKIDGC